MTIEEKAKAYDEALEGIRGYIKSLKNVHDGIWSAKDIENHLSKYFPELKESEDERIRKELIAIYSVGAKVNAKTGDIPDRDIVAWLEKNGEPVEINPDEFDSRLNRLLKQFETLSKEELASSLSFYLNVVQNDGTYKDEEKQAQSEEDEHRIKAIIYFLDIAKKHYASTVEIDICIDWLKSLKPQNRL